VTITLSAASSSTITVTVGVVAGGTATAGTDYTGGTAVLLTFSPGQTAKTFAITVLGERTPEADETVLVGLSGVSAGATIADGQGVVTILNDDGTPLLAPASGAGATSALRAAEIDRALADAGDSSVQPIVEDAAPFLGSAAFSDPQAASSLLEPGPAPVEGDAGVIDSSAAERPIQVVRLDLDGATDLTYRGPVTIADVDVTAFTGLGAFAGHEAAIVPSMPAMQESPFADHGAVFTIDRVRDLLPGDVSSDHTARISCDAPVRFIHDPLLEPFPGDLSAAADTDRVTLSAVAAAGLVPLMFTRSSGSFELDGFRTGRQIFGFGFANAANNGDRHAVLDVLGSGVTGTGDEALVTRGERRPILDQGPLRIRPS